MLLQLLLAGFCLRDNGRGGGGLVDLGGIEENSLEMLSHILPLRLLVTDDDIDDTENGAAVGLKSLSLKLLLRFGVVW